MPIDNAAKFVDIVSSPTFETDHPQAHEQLHAAVKADDPDAAAALGAQHFDLDFTGAELKQVGAHVENLTGGIGTGEPKPMLRSTASFANASPQLSYGPGGGPTIGLPFAAGIALKVALKTLADQLKAQGKSPAEIQAALEAYAGGIVGPDGRPLDLKSNITGVGVIDDIIKNTVSVTVGTVQQVAQTTKTIIQKIFSGW